MPLPFRPVILYINGELWGIYQIRERINADYLRDHFGIEDADLLEWNHRSTPKIKEGNLKRWNETESFFEKNSLRSDAKFQRAQDFVDLDNFIDYNILGTGESTTDFTVSVHVSAPEITSFSPSSGNVGTDVTITGKHFSEVTSVSFGEQLSRDFSATSDTTIQAQVPEGVKTAKIRIITPGGTAESATDFIVELPQSFPPTIARFTPVKGRVGDEILIEGAHFGGVTSVTFGNTLASEFTAASDTSVVAIVPQGASDGKLTITTLVGRTPAKIRLR
ncbi:IPT/TIG domain-containing protein [bacterium]|nr:IPT/TIG domain-containing protein [bacterium]